MPLKRDRKETLSIEIAKQSILDFNSVIEKDKNGRYMSWVHCYNVFKNKRKDKSEENIDYLALHLAISLASWGMIRGSSFLLQKDYKAHSEVVRIILEDKYDVLLSIKAEELLKESNLELLFELSDRISHAYAELLPSKKNIKNHATDTLITKILLGTLGCVPAYDR